jgi:hypothetical protein
MNHENIMSEKTIVVVVVYDRFDNLKEWVRCWNMCETQGYQLVVIHNYENTEARDAYLNFCAQAGVSYVPRVNIGYDIGAFQDVCRDRLKDFPEWSTLIWCTDDNLPMRKDFIKQYVDKMTAGVGVVAMEISTQVRLHIRTTGFCIRKEVAQRLTFNCDPLKTKEDCYQFEHRNISNHFLLQIQRMKLKSVQVCDIRTSPFWDSGNKRTKTREREHYLMFPKPSASTKKVVFICPVYNSYPEIISSLINQTHSNWELLLIHDGPSELDINSIVLAAKDERITYLETEKRAGNWGHSIRRDWLRKLKDSDADYIVITNADNFYAPVFCEYMIKGFDNGQVATYCSKMGHSYTAWGVIDCKIEQGYIDCGSVMVRADVATEIGWNDIHSHSSDWLYFNDIIQKHGKEKFAKVEGLLFIHN